MAKGTTMFKTENRVFWLIVTGGDYATAPQLATRMGVSGTCVRRWLRSLETRGFVSRGFRTQAIQWQLTDAGKAFAEQFKDESAVPVIEDKDAPVDTVEAVQAIEVSEPAPVGAIEHPTFADMKEYLRNGGYRFIWLTGEAGGGKTFGVEQAADYLNAALYLATPVSDKYELMGYNDAQGTLNETEVYRWATHEGPAVLLLDEVDGNLANALLALNSMLANGIGVFPNGKVRIADDKYVIATANTTGHGATIKYCGRQPLDQAFIDRFELQLNWGIHEPTERAIALKKVPGCEAAVEMSWKIRRNLAKYGIDLDWGPRRTYAFCRGIVKTKFSARKIAIDVALSRLSEEEQNNALEGVR